jgi:hypothetical protein
MMQPSKAGEIGANTRSVPRSTPPLNVIGMVGDLAYRAGLDLALLAIGLGLLAWLMWLVG